MSPDQVGDILLQSFKEINLKSNQVFGPGKNIFFLESPVLLRSRVNQRKPGSEVVTVAQMAED